MKSGGLILWNATAIFETLNTSWWMRKTPFERRFGETIKGPIVPFGAMVKYHPISIRDRSRLQQFGKKVLPGIFLGCALIAEGIRKGDILIVDLEELETMNASEVHPRMINAKEVLITQKGEEVIFPEEDGAAELFGRDYEFREFTLRRKQTIRSEGLSGEAPGESEESQPTEPKDDAEARRHSWLFHGDFILSSSQ